LAATLEIALHAWLSFNFRNKMNSNFEKAMKLPSDFLASLGQVVVAWSTFEHNLAIDRLGKDEVCQNGLRG
jgi:hypothetical protein